MKKFECTNQYCKNPDRLRYVCQVIEYHSMYQWPDEDGFVELDSLVESLPDHKMQPYILCNDCMQKFNLAGERIEG